MAKRKDKIDKAIEAAFYSCCSGVQIPIMEIGALFQHGRQWLESTQDKPHGLGHELREYCRAHNYEGA